MNDVKRLHESALEASKEGNHRVALATLSEAASVWYQLKEQKNANNSSSLDEWKQIFLRDQKRFTEAVYGIEGSDGRMFLWKHHLLTNRYYPPQVTFYAWARHKDTIYRIGGFKPPNLLFPYSEKELVWAFSLETKTWRCVKVAGGKSPGLRAEHKAFVHEDGLYVLGGTYMERQLDMKLYRLDLNTLQWKVVKVKGSFPPGRCEFGLCMYRNKVYVHGGFSEGSGEYFSDLWCLELGKSKPEWRRLDSGSAALPRKSHCIFSDGQAVFIVGGLSHPNGKYAPTGRTSIKAFESYHLKDKKWQKLACVGDDPWEVAEACCLTLYEGQEEPQSVLVYGGYLEQQSMNVCDFEEPLPMLTKGQWALKKDQWEYRLVGLPYSRRLLSFNFATKSWRSLKPARSDLALTAQCLAAELNGDDDMTTKVLIVGGYGITHDTEETKFESEDPLAMMMMSGVREDKDNSTDICMTPAIKQDVLEFQMQASTAPCFTDRVASRSGWEWDFFAGSCSKLPQISLSFAIGSPTSHWLPQTAEDDFRPPPSGPVLDNDEPTVLGRLVLFRDLKGRKDLNGTVGRCGPWMSLQNRYIVSVRNETKVASVVVKSVNLSFPPQALDITKELKDIMSRGAPANIRPTTVVGVWATGSNHCPLDPLPGDDESKYAIGSDTYRGPISARALSILNYVSDMKNDGKSYGLATIPSMNKKILTQEQIDRQAKVDYYLQFVRDLRKSDGERCEARQKRVIDSRDEPSWSQWLNIKVTLDGLAPTMERELLVSSKMTMQELHHQVLTAAIGWHGNYHAYAFRSILPDKVLGSKSDILETDTSILKALEDEYWIGPTRSTALDVFFQPLYIGGAMVDDREIFLGDLFFPKKKEVCHLQYVHDFGAWWSHTIEIRRQSIPVPDGSPPAVLLDAKMTCPPDDVQGIEELTQKLGKLAGADSSSLSPAKAEWWKLMNDGWRAKANYSDGFCDFDPLKFDIERYRGNLKDALLVPVPKRGRESKHMTMSNFSSGLSGTAAGPGAEKQQIKKQLSDPTKYCAVCNVTVALSLCAGCRSVAFCSRDHQLQYWPEHKAACKAAQKQQKKTTSKRG